VKYGHDETVAIKVDGNTQADVAMDQQLVVAHRRVEVGKLS
jgi:hypothetical protein